MTDINRELRVMHACEKGATGVYRGHKCVARYFFRKNLGEIDTMRAQEREHSNIFEKLLSERNSRTCYFSNMFFWGGLLYGVFIGLFGLKAIGASTSEIENIVNAEFDLSITKLKNEKKICSIIKEIQLDELQHRDYGQNLAKQSESKFIRRIASISSYAAKYLAQRL